MPASSAALSLTHALSWYLTHSRSRVTAACWHLTRVMFVDCMPRGLANPISQIIDSLANYETEEQRNEVDALFRDRAAVQAKRRRELVKALCASF